MALHKTTERVILVVIVALFIGTGLLYSVSTPFLDVSDEVRHYAMVEQLAQGKGLPVQDPAQHGFYEQEGSQPPLYYAVMALVALPFDRSDFRQLAQFNPHALLGRADAANNFNQLIHTSVEEFPWHGTVLVVQAIRLLGIVMGAVTVICSYGIARCLMTMDESNASNESHTIIPLVAAAFTAFNPMFVFIMASVNNDTLATMLSSFSLLIGLRIIRTRLTWRNAIVLGVVLGGAALSKSSALALVGIIPLAIIVREWLRRREGMSANKHVGKLTTVLALVTPLLLIIVPVALIAGWWYARNAVLYNGDFTGTTMMATIAGARDRLPTALELIAEWDGFLKSYLGLFGAVNIPMAEVIYRAFEIILLVTGFGLLTLIRDSVRGRRQGNQVLRSTQAIGVLMCFGAFLVAFAALIRWTSITLASQGRLLFPVIAVISAFIAIGLGRLSASAAMPLMWRRISGGFIIAICAGWALVTFASPFLYIRPAYATPARLPSEPQLPVDIVKPELRFENDIRWLGYRVETPRVQPGEEFIVTLYWQGLKPMTTNYSAFIRLYGRDNTQAVLLDTYPGGGMWQTTRWLPGEIIADRYRLRIPDTITNTRLMPTALWLDVGYWNTETKEFLQTFDGTGNQTGRQRYEAGALAANQAITNSVKPTGAHLSAASATVTSMTQNADKLVVTVKWLAVSDFSEDYTVFMHLFDSNGNKVAQADGPAMNGLFPSRWWRTGDVIDDTHTFSLPAELPAGEYTIKYGLYKRSDGARMAGFDVQGQPINDAALTQTVTLLARRAAGEVK